MKYPTHKLMLVALAASTVSLTGTTQVFAQATERYQQGIAKKPSRQVRLSPRNDIDVSTDETVILPALKGVVISNSPDSVKSSGASGSGVVTSGDVVPDQVIKAAEAHIGGTVSFASLDRMTRDMVLAFRSAGIPVVNVVVPPQDVSNGVVQIIAVVGRVGKVSVSGDSTNPGYYTDGFALEKGEVVTEAAVLDQLRWKSRRAHRRVDAIYAPGTSFSDTDIEFSVTEEKPWSIFFGADNTGSGGVGDYRLFGGFTVGDLWGLDHELSYQGTTSEEGFDGLNAHVLSYILPVASRTDLQLSGAFVESSSPLVIGNSSGQNYQLGATFITQIPRFKSVSLDARYGFEYKNSDNTFEFGGTAAAGNETEVGQFFVQLEGQRGNSKSQTDFFAGVWVSPGNLFSHDNDVAYGGNRADAKAQYIYARGGINHKMYLKNDWQFNIEVEGQISNERLIASEQIFLGGLNTVRGFDENSVRGDSGAFTRLELYTPAKSFMKNGRKDAIRGYGFFDAGVVSVRGTPQVLEGSASISSAGIGLIYQYENNLTVEAAYGWKLNQDSLSRDQDDGQFHFRVLTRY